MQYIEIGPVPGEEHCAQVGSPDYTEASLRECEVFRRMLYRLFPVPEGLPVAYVGRTHPHDFGNYREVSIRYDDANNEAVETGSGLHDVVEGGAGAGAFRLRDGAGQRRIRGGGPERPGA